MKRSKSEYYSIRSILGVCWAIFIFLIGAREAGKSYATTDFFCRQFKKYGRPFYWLRLSESSAKKLLQNNAEKLIDPDLRRKYDLDLFVNGNNVYQITERDPKTLKIKKKVLMARVFSLATFYNDKGSGLFDKDFLNDPNMFYNICLDEMNREDNEKNNFDIVYNFANQLENLVRSVKERIRIVCIGNNLQEASDLLCAFNFIPQEFGRYYLKKKKCVIDYIPNSEKYIERRKGAVANILAGDNSTFTNKIEYDVSLVDKKRLISPSYIIEFSKTEKYVVWDGNIIAEYNGEKSKNIIAMRPYLDVVFSDERRNNVIALFDARAFKFHRLIAYQKFKKALELLRPRK